MTPGGLEPCLFGDPKGQGGFSLIGQCIQCAEEQGRSALPLSYTLSHFNDFYFKTGIHLVISVGLEPTLHSKQALNVAILLLLLPK